MGDIALIQDVLRLRASGMSLAPAPLKVALPPDASLRREWNLVCEAPDYPACVTGWEFPGQTGAEVDRRFEVLWTVDPRVVRDAALICTHLAESLSPGLGHLRDVLPTDLPPPASADLQRATGVLNRMTGYLERAAGE
jgi:DICT domain-containing protein